MLAVDRRKKITELIQKNNSVIVPELAKLFDVTTETIRGDLEKLERQGVLVRTYGGAVLAEGSDSDMTISDRDVINFEGKQRIGIAASKSFRAMTTYELFQQVDFFIQRICLTLEESLKKQSARTILPIKCSSPAVVQLFHEA